MAGKIPFGILETLQQPTSIADSNYVYTYVNPAFCEHYQKSKKDVIGSKVEDIAGKDWFMDKIKPYFDQCIRGKETSYDFPAGKDISQSVTKVHLHPYCSDNGDINGVISIGELQVSKEKSLNELKEPEREFQILTENSTDLIYTTDLSQKFTYISPSVKKTLGYTVSEALNLHARDIMTEESYQDQLQAFEKVLANPSGNKHTSEIKALKLKCKDGTTIWGEVHARLLFDRSNQPSGVIGICRDNTRRKRIENALRKSEEKFRNIFHFASRDEEHRRNVMWLSKSAQDFLELSAIDDI